MFKFVQSEWIEVCLAEGKTIIRKVGKKITENFS